MDQFELWALIKYLRASAAHSSAGERQKREHIEVLTHVHGTRANSYGDRSAMANLSAEEPYALT
jgi:hypothetical protein